MTTRILAPSELTADFDPAALGFEDTSQIRDTPNGWIGQSRAENAARFGLRMARPDYHLFVLGEPGSGRSSLMFRLMQETASGRPPAPDRVYLHRFDCPERPWAMLLAPGQGAVLRATMETFVERITREIPRRLEEESIRLDSERLKKSMRQSVEQAYTALVAFAAERRFSLRREEGRLLFTLMDENGQAMQEDVLLALPAEQRLEMERAEQALRTEIGRYLDIARPQEEALEQALDKLRHDAVQPLVDAEIAHVREVLAGKLLDAQRFETYLAAVGNDVMQALPLFTASDEEAAEQRSARLGNYRVNVLVDNAQVAGAPALRDDDPTFRSLFGGIDFHAEGGVLSTDFTRIRSGHLQRAHGGCLLLQLRDVLRDPDVWEKLQRYLRNGSVQIEEPGAGLGPLTAATLEPEPLAVDTKLILVGSREEYYLLQEMDAELMRHFRVKVDFAVTFPATLEIRRALASFMAVRATALGLPHFTASAVARLQLEMQRVIDDQRHLCTELGRLEGWMVEAAAFAPSGETVTAETVEAALTAARARHDYPEEETLDAIASGELIIRVEGSVAGQVNGLAQVDLGDYRFGLPVRLTAQTYAGDEGVINIDREVEMTGPTHDKGVMILSGWLSAAFAHLAPLSLSASLVFEQEYHGVEGDSASCAELFALLSALSGVPAAQGLAVTGALNQHGEVMPVGGINEKIEGWYRTCKRLGLDGHQGVMIPARNCAHLVLDKEVREAVARGEFRIVAMEHVLDGIALLTGMSAGEPDAEGHYPEDSVMGRAQRRLEDYRKACEDSGHGREHEHGK